MKVFYAVPWVDIEFGWGGKPDGYKIFEDLNECINQSKIDSETGNYGSGYLGPERPLHYYKTVDKLTNISFVDKLNFKSEPKYIK